MVYSGGPYISLGTFAPFTETTPLHILERLVNGGFETGVLLPQWIATGAGGWYITTSPKHSGTYAAISNTGGGGIKQIISGSALLGSAVTEFSFWAKGYAAGNKIGVEVHYTDTSYDEIVGGLTLTDSWVKYDKTSMIDDAKTIAYIQFHIISGENYLDDASLIETIPAQTVDITIGPLNLPYARVSDNIQTIIEKTITDTFVPWEWWLDYTGAFQVAEERGTDKSASINLEAAIHIGESTNERSSKQTKQRVRVVGRGESADQDENTSDWHEDTTEMATINSFYEYVQGEKTISSKSEADIWSQVLLTLEASINQEITIRLENNPYTTNDFDVGDYITATDPATLISGKVRVKTIETNVDGDGGEVTTVTCTKRRTDISDRLADIYKTLEKLMLSSTYIDAMYAEGGSQTKLNANVVEDVWEQTASNKWDTQLPEESPATEITQCNWDGTVAYSCDKDLFEITCNPNSYGGVMLDQPRLKFSRNPRFTCEFEIDTDTGNAWEDGDFAYIRIWQVDDAGGLCAAPYGDAGFGFRIMKTGGVYELRSYLNDGTGSTVEIKIANLTTDIKYIVEARLQWKEKIAMFYFGKADVEKDDPDYGFRLRGIAPMSLESADEDNLTPFHVVIDSRHGAETQTLVIPIYRWKTQAIRAVEG